MTSPGCTSKASRPDISEFKCFVNSFQHHHRHMSMAESRNRWHCEVFGTNSRSTASWFERVLTRWKLSEKCDSLIFYKQLDHNQSKHMPRNLTSKWEIDVTQDTAKFLPHSIHGRFGQKNKSIGGHPLQRVVQFSFCPSFFAMPWIGRENLVSSQHRSRTIASGVLQEDVISRQSLLSQHTR